MDDEDSSISVEVEPDVILDVGDDSNESEEFVKTINFKKKLIEYNSMEKNNLNANLRTASEILYANHFLQPRLEQCSECGNYYRRLARHMMNSHAKTEEERVKVLSCQFCKESFQKRSLLEIHLKNHAGTKPFVCSTCNKAFSQNCNLINHMRVHTGDKPFKCPLCDRRFTQSGNLNNHMRLHNDEKPYVCSICCQGFRQLSNLNNHSKKHFEAAKVGSLLT